MAETDGKAWSFGIATRAPEEGAIGARLEGRGETPGWVDGKMLLSFFAYILRCRDGTFYVGHTDQMEKRLAEHELGLGGRHTRTRLPVELVWSRRFSTRDEAKVAERKLKGWNRAKKMALIAGDFDLISRIGGRGEDSRALRDALLRKAPQGRGS